MQSSQSLPPSQPWVLVAEDDDHDYFFLTRAVSKVTSGLLLVRMKNGVEAMHYLQENIARPPNLIITDLKMPGVDGFGLLSWLRSNPRLTHVPVFVWSGSELPKDRDKAKALEARFYYPNGTSHTGLTALVAEICAILPSSPRL